MFVAAVWSSVYDVEAQLQSPFVDVSCIDMVVLRMWVLLEEVVLRNSMVCKTPLVSISLGSHSADTSERRLDNPLAEQGISW